MVKYYGENVTNYLYFNVIRNIESLEKNEKFADENLKNSTPLSKETRGGGLYQIDEKSTSSFESEVS